MTGGSSAGEVQGYYRRIAPFLDDELADRGDGGFWEWAASTPAGCRVLEVGAGTGRATRFLLHTAGQVVAFDLSLELIAMARRRLAGSPHCRLFVGDMRQLGAAARFDLVVAVDDPFAHLLADRERDAVLAALAAHLAPGGRFILDAAWLAPPQRALARRAAGLVRERFRGGGNAELRVREEIHCHAGRICDTAIAYSRAGEVLAATTYRSRLWSQAEVRRRYAAAGLAVCQLWGDYDRRPFDRRTSARLLVEARAAPPRR